MGENRELELMKRRVNLFVVILFLVAGLFFLVTAIQSCTSLNTRYVQAHRSTFDAIIPEYLDYVSKDATLTQEQKDLRRATVAGWNALLLEAEKTGAER